MLVHTAGGESHLLDFFVAAPGQGLAEPEPAELVPIDVALLRGRGPGVPRRPVVVRRLRQPARAGAMRSSGSASMPLAELAARAGARGARRRRGHADAGAQFFEILGPILTLTRPRRGAIYAPEGTLLRAGETIRMPELGDLLERLGAEGPGFLYEGDVARAPSATGCSSAAGCSPREDLAELRVVEREPARARATAAARSSPTRRRRRAAS